MVVFTLDACLLFGSGSRFCSLLRFTEFVAFRIILCRMQFSVELTHTYRSGRICRIHRDS